jgi:hypothetical protein
MTKGVDQGVEDRHRGASPSIEAKTAGRATIR